MTVMQGDTSVMTHMYTYIAKGGLYMDTSDPPVGDGVYVYVCTFTPPPPTHPTPRCLVTLTSAVTLLTCRVEG